MSSNYSIPPYSPYSPRDLNSNASQSPWSASSNTGSGYDSHSLAFPPINLNLSPNADADLNFDFTDNELYFDSLPRLLSPNPHLDEPSSSGSQEQQQQPPPSNQEQALRPLSSQYQASESSDPFEDFIEQDFEYQPSPRPDPAQEPACAPNVVDLTESSPPPASMAPSRKRKANTPGEGRSVRQYRQTPSRSSRSTPARKQNAEQATVVDLVDIEDDEQYKDFKAKQQAEAIRQQQQDEAKKPVKLAEFQCIICMDNPTDLTVTHCGHLFCSECLHQALYAGNAKKCCPVCRTTINTSSVGNQKKQPKNGIFALEMKLMTANKKGKQPVRPLQE